MKYIITGATSFIGVELCQYLLARGHEVYAICRQVSEKAEILPKDANLHIVFSDMSDYRNLGQKVEQADVFVNLAWNPTDHEGCAQKDAQITNIEYSLDAIMASRHIGCKLFIEAGSQAEYGITKERQSERTLCYPHTEYGRAKYVLYSMASEYARMVGMKYIHLRIFSTYGASDKSWTLISTSFDKMLKNEPIDLSPCMQNWNFIYVKDAVKQISLLSEYAISKEDFKLEVFQIASEDTRCLRYFIMEMKEILKSSSELRFGAGQAQNVVSLQPDMTKTKAAIGFISDYSFADGIREILKIRNNCVLWKKRS